MEYTVKSIKVGDFTDNYGNAWTDVAFEGVSEPVKWVMKDPSKVKVGDKVYGHITEQTSKAGKTYLKFKKEQKPEPGQEPVDWNRKDAYIRFQWAYREALAHYDRTGKEVVLGDIRTLANGLVKMVDEDVTEYLVWSDYSPLAYEA